MVIDRDHPGFAFFELSFAQLAAAAVQAALLSEADAAAMSERLAAAGYRISTPTLVAAFARRP